MLAIMKMRHVTNTRNFIRMRTTKHTVLYRGVSYKEFYLCTENIIIEASVLNIFYRIN